MTKGPTIDVRLIKLVSAPCSSPCSFEGTVPSNEQGELQGALTSLMSLTSIVGPLVMTYLFAYFTKNNAPVHFAGAPFLLGAVLMLVSAVISYYALHTRKVFI